MKINFSQSLKILFIAFFSITLANCSPKTSYQSINNTPISSYFSVQDQVSLVKELSSQLTTSIVINQAISTTKPTLLVDVIKNKTSEQIDTESITDTLKKDIINSGLFKIINRNNLNLLAKEQQLNSLGLTDSNKASQLGKLYGAKYVLYGNFSSIINYVRKSKNTYYKLNLFLQNIETSEEIWVGEASINKVTK